MKLLLSSFGPSPAHDAALVDLVGKPLREIRVGDIENAHDVYDDPGSLREGREGLRRDGYAFDLIDLRDWRADIVGLRTLLERFDASLLAGGGPYCSSARSCDSRAGGNISDCVRDRAVYAGATRQPWSQARPWVLSASGWILPKRDAHLGRTRPHATVVAPHIENPEFGGGCRKAGDLCERDGYAVVALREAQALDIDW